MKIRTLATLACAGLAAVSLSEPAAGQLVEMHSYWNPGSADNLCSTNPSFLIAPPAGYTEYRTEGYVFPAAPAGLLGLKPLHRWLNTSLGDYFTTSNPAWFGSSGASQGGYSWNRMDGWVFPEPVAGTGDLRLYFSSSRGDNFTSADPYYTSFIPAPGYTSVGNQGYVIRTAEGETALADSFGFGTMGGGPSGFRPLLVLLLQYTDFPMRHTRNDFLATFFGLGSPTVLGYFYGQSFGEFTWSNAGVRGPYTVFDEPDTTGNEALWRDTWDGNHAPFLYLFLRTSNSANFVTCSGLSAAAAGGNAFGADAFEHFTLNDINGGNLISGDSVAFKTYNKTFLRVSGTSIVGDAPNSTGADTRFTITKVSGSAGTQVRTGDVVRLLASTGRFLRSTGGGGGTLVVDLTTATTECNFNMFKGGPPIAWQVREGLRQAAGAGFNPATFDTNSDGTVTTNEMQMYVIGSGPADPPAQPDGSDAAAVDGTATRYGGYYQPPGSSVFVDGGAMPGAGEDVSFISICHELAHCLGATDLYGAFAALNYSATLMGATIFNNSSDQRTFNLDPWHRMRLGWLQPRIFNLDDAGHVATLEVTDDGPDALARRPIVLYERARFNPDTGAGEFFMLEFRNPNWTANNYDENGPGAGLLVWQCRTLADAQALAIPSVFGACCNGTACQVIRQPSCTSPRVYRGQGTVCTPTNPCPSGTTTPGFIDGSINALGAPNGTRGDSRPWQLLDLPTAGFVPTYTDNMPAPVHVRIAAFPATSRSAQVEWSYSGSLPPRIDSVSPTRFRRGRVLTFTGVLGVRQPTTRFYSSAGTLTSGSLISTTFTPTTLTGRIAWNSSTVLGTRHVALTTNGQTFEGNRVDLTILHAADWNESGSISVQDIFDFLTSYFSNDGDFNGTGFTTVQDIFDFLAAYFDGI